MTKLEIAVLLSDAVNAINSLKTQMETIKEALDQTVDWDALEGTDCQPDQ